MWWTLATVIWLWTTTPFYTEPPNSNTPTLVQRKPHDRGNCFHWTGCRGDSIGATWIQTPDLCKALGGKSWLDNQLKCHNLPPGMMGLI